MPSCERSGLIIIDKPAGVTSAEVVRRLKRAFGFRRVGHAGTLDPFATGLLIVVCGKATKVQSLFLDAKKTYEGTILLGRRTTTDDVTGETILEDNELEFKKYFTRAQLISELKKHFSGPILQVPPQVSAIKVNGERSYKLSRLGIVSNLSPREVNVEFQALEFDGAERLHYRVAVSKGTYIRSLARDIGDFLKSAACLESIRRIGSEPFVLEEAIPLEEALRSELGDILIPLETLT